MEIMEEEEERKMCYCVKKKNRLAFSMVSAVGIAKTALTFRGGISFRRNTAAL